MAAKEIEVTNMIIGGDAKNLLNAMELESKNTLDMQAWASFNRFFIFEILLNNSFLNLYSILWCRFVYYKGKHEPASSTKLKNDHSFFVNIY